MCAEDCPRFNQRVLAVGGSQAFLGSLPLTSARPVPCCRSLLQLGVFSLDTKLDSFAYSPGGAFIPPAWRGSDLPLIWSCDPTAPSEGERAASNHLPASCCCQCSFRCLSTNRHIRHLSH